MHLNSRDFSNINFDKRYKLYNQVCEHFYEGVRVRNHYDKINCLNT